MSGAVASASQEEIRAAQQQLGREMVRLRKGLGYSQTRLALKVEHARGTLHACEQGNRTLGSHELWQDIDDALGVGGALVRQRDEIAAMAAVAADEAVRAGVRAPGGRPLAGTIPGGGGDPITAARVCPACGHSLVLRMTVLAVRVPDQLAAATALTRPARQAARRAGGRIRPGLRCRSSARSPGRLPGCRGGRSRRRTGPRTGRSRRW